VSRDGQRASAHDDLTGVHRRSFHRRTPTRRTFGAPVELFDGKSSTRSRS
jgi:hypothetical protein